MSSKSPQEAHALVLAGKAILVDVREKDELQESGIIDGALWMPMSEMAEDSDQWRLFKQNLPKDKQILVYCKSGGRSGRVAEFLCCDEFQAENVGGFATWKAAGIPVKPFTP